MRFKICLLFILAFVISCTQSVDINVVNSDGRTPTMNCILYANSDSIVAELTYSRSITSISSFQKINNAMVVLFDDTVSVGLFSEIDSGKYLLNHLPQSGHSYRIEAKFDNHYIFATTKMPEPASYHIEKIDSSRAFFGTNIFGLTLNTKQLANTDIWINASSIQRQSDILTRMNSAIYSNSIYLDNFSRSIDSWEDYKFNYYPYTKIAVPDFKTDSIFIDFGLQGQANYEISVLAVDPIYSAYMKSSILAFYSDMFIDESPLNSSSVQIYSNIKGGIGIFGAINYSSKFYPKAQ